MNYSFFVVIFSSSLYIFIEEFFNKKILVQPHKRNLKNPKKNKKSEKTKKFEKNKNSKKLKKSKKNKKS